MTTTIRLSGPADVLTVLPYQLGFHPRRCLVVVSLRGTRMGLVQRIDLPPPEHVFDAVNAVLSPLLKDPPQAVLLIGFDDSEGESRAMLDEMTDACLAYRIEVDDRMVVRDGRWYDLDCVQSCCPREGLPLPEPSEVPAVAEFVGREIFPLPDRSSLADLLEPSRSLAGGAVSRLADEWLDLRCEATGTTRRSRVRSGERHPHAASTELPPAKGGLQSAERGLHAVESGLRFADIELPVTQRELHDFRASELAVWSRVLCDDDDAEPIPELPPQDRAMLAASLTDVDLRDALIAWLCPGTLAPDLIDPVLFVQLSDALPRPWLVPDEGDAAMDDEGEADAMERAIRGQRIERRLCELSAGLPDEWAAPTLTLLAAFTWWRGDGALTRIALDRALRTEPDYRLAQLLERMVDLAVRPERAAV